MRYLFKLLRVKPMPSMTWRVVARHGPFQL